ncbi:MAG: transcription initiation factor IIB family protein [Halorubrum sp.]
MSQARPTRVRSHRSQHTRTDDETTRRSRSDTKQTAGTESSRIDAVDCCPECSGRTRVESAERICTECGLVVDADRIDYGPEWRSFADDETNPKRTGAPLTRSRHDRGLSTEIGRSTKLKGRKRRRLARMRTQHNRARIATKRDRNKVYAYTEIRRLVGALDLSTSVRDTACALFDSAQSESLLRGRSLEGFACACVYVACRTANVARTVDELCAEAKASENEHRAAFDAMNRELGLPIGPTSPAEYLPRFASELDCPPAVERRARDLVDRAVETGIANGRNPIGVAAACLYTAARESDSGCTQQDAADVADVTPVTIRRTYVDLTDGE